jgi:sulfite reductase (NADPH) flavoprotein alpha-component
MSVPARLVLDAAAADRAATGNENRGFLSEEFGLLPIEPPRQELGEHHQAWDALGARIPELFGSVLGREALDAMPVLSADPDVLPDDHLMRAACLLGVFAHTYVRVRPDEPERLPECITAPWEVVCRRLGRHVTAMTFDEVVAYNWRYRDPAHPGRRLEDLALIVPVVGTSAESTFSLVQVEIIAEMTPAVNAFVRAQEAVVGGSEGALCDEIGLLIDRLDYVTRHSFPKINPNPHSPTYVDPVLWAKTIAPFAVALEEGHHTISGSSATPFQALDVFIGRRSYQSRVGQEYISLREIFSPNVRDYLEALGKVSVADAARRGSPRLQGLWRSLIDAYCGDRGFLGLHRLKAYGYLEIAFKIGRSVTTGGFSGLFEDQTWDLAVTELEASRQERREGYESRCPVAHSAGGGRLTGEGLAHVHFDVNDVGLRFRAGDRLAVEPHNGPDLVARTIRALGATGDEPIRLDQEWRAVLELDEVPMRDLLARGQIRPVGRAVAKALLSFSNSQRLGRIVNQRAEGRWELWDLLDEMAEGGFDPRELWRADPWEPYSLPKIVPPESSRLYSIASAMDDPLAASNVELLAAELRYSTPGTEVSREGVRLGTGSSFLARLAREGSAPVGVQITPSSRFRLPEDSSRPIVMFAGGAGMSAFRAFIAERGAGPDGGPMWLFLSTRTERHRDLYAQEMEGVRFDAAVTRAASEPRRRIDDLIAQHADELSDLAADPATVFYVCGPSGFAVTVIDSLEQLTSRDRVRSMIGEGRLQQDVFWSAPAEDQVFPLFDASEVATRNDDAGGHWTIIDGAVYDLSEFAHRHPGGPAIVHEVSGRDGTHAYRQIEHHLDPEVEAMLQMYRVGTIRRLDFGPRGAPVIGEDGLTYMQLADLFRSWARFLHLVVEIENAVRHDFSIVDYELIRGDKPEQMTFLRAQLLLEAHMRFRRIYLAALLGERIARLWADSTAFVAPGEDVRELERLIESACPGGGSGEDGIDEVARQFRALGAADVGTRERALYRLAELREPIQEADLTFLAELKASAIAAVRLFEEHERETPERAREALLAPLRGIPPLLAALDSAVAESTRDWMAPTLVS